MSLATANVAIGTALPTPDFSGVTDMSASAGKVALARIVTSLACGAAGNLCPSTNIVDLVGYGAATDFEGSAAAPQLSSAKADLRGEGGCLDTDDNGGDFTAVAPAARTSASPLSFCADDAGSIVVTLDAASGDAGPADDVASSEDTGASLDAGTAPNASNEDGGGSDDAGLAEDAGVPPIDAGTDAALDAASPLDSGAGSLDGGTTSYAGIVISQVFGGGGNSGAPYDADFVELFNRSTASLSLEGLSLQYGSKTGTFGALLSDGGPSGNILALPAVALAPGEYFLVGLDSNAATGSPLPTPDADGGLALSSTGGKVALVTLGCGTVANLCPQTYVVDMVGYGGASDYEGSGAAGTLSNTTSAQRLGNGCVDTRNNAADFVVAAPAPRNDATARVDCSAQGMTDAGIDSGARSGGDGGMSSGTDAGSPAQDDAGGSINDADSGSSANDASAPAGGDDAGTPVTFDDAGAEDGGLGGNAGGSGCSCTTAGLERGNADGLPVLGALAMIGALSIRQRRASRRR